MNRDDHDAWKAIDTALFKVWEDHRQWVEAQEKSGRMPQGMVDSAEAGHQAALRITAGIPRDSGPGAWMRAAVRELLDAAHYMQGEDDYSYGSSSVQRPARVLETLELELFEVPPESKLDLGSLHRAMRADLLKMLPVPMPTPHERNWLPWYAKASNAIKTLPAPDFDADIETWWQRVFAWVEGLPTEPEAIAQARGAIKGRVEHFHRRASGRW